MSVEPTTREEATAARLAEHHARVAARVRTTVDELIRTTPDGDKAGHRYIGALINVQLSRFMVAYILRALVRDNGSDSDEFARRLWDTANEPEYMDQLLTQWIEEYGPEPATT